MDDWGHLVEDGTGTRWFYATLMDATERVREREELRRANERLEILTALSNDVLFDIECGTGKAHVYALIALINPAKGIEFYGTSGFNSVVRDIMEVAGQTPPSIYEEAASLRKKMRLYCAVRELFDSTTAS